MFSFSLLLCEPQWRGVVSVFAANRGRVKLGSGGLAGKLHAALEPSWPVDGQPCEKDDQEERGGELRL